MASSCQSNGGSINNIPLLWRSRSDARSHTALQFQSQLCIKRIVVFQYDWLVVQVHAKDVLRCSIAVNGELCVMMDLLMRQRESFVTCSDTGRLLSHLHSFTLQLTQNGTFIMLV